MDELKSRNVDALFSAFREHDERMTKAASGLTESLGRLADEISSQQSLLSQLVEEFTHRKEEPS